MESMVTVDLDDCNKKSRSNSDSFEMDFDDFKNDTL